MLTNQLGSREYHRDPWERRTPQRQRSVNQDPPELRDIWEQLVKKVNQRQGSLGSSALFNGKGFEGFGLLVLLLAALWGLCGLHTINEIERGVVTRFGRFSHIESPGLQWRAPLIDRVQRVDVGTIRSLSTSGFMLTRDENLIRVEMNVQYRVTNPVNYLFSVTNADNSLQQATDSALRYVIGHTTMNEVLTRGRFKVRDDTKQLLHQIIAAYDTGLEIVDVNFQQARPPEEVKAAFDDAIAAQEDQQRYIREAEAYARAREPQARGDAKRLEEEALAYKEVVILRAQGEIDRFNQLLPQYLKAPQITQERLYIETLEQILGKTPKVLLGDHAANSLMLLPLEQLMKQSLTQNSMLPPSSLPQQTEKSSKAEKSPSGSTTLKRARYGS